MNINRVIAVIILVIGVNFGAVFSANALEVDLATKGSNSLGWSSMGECRASSSSSCISIVDGCGGYDIYTTDRTDDALSWALKRGDSIYINILKEGRFAGYLCRLDPR